jgi:hypothetical protein
LELLFIPIASHFSGFPAVIRPSDSSAVRRVGKLAVLAACRRRDVETGRAASVAGGSTARGKTGRL